MLEYTVFRGWFYGTSTEALKEDAVNIGVFNPAGIVSLLEREDVDLKVFYVRAPAKMRLLRQLDRESEPDCLEITRRFHTDYQDFSDIHFSYVDIPNDTIHCLHTQPYLILRQLQDWMS